MPKSSCEVPLLSKKVKVLHLIRKKKKSYVDVAKIYGKNKSICKIVNKQKEMYASFAVTPQTAKLIAKVSDKSLVKIIKQLNLWVEDVKRNMLRLKAVGFSLPLGPCGIHRWIRRGLL